MNMTGIICFSLNPSRCEILLARSRPQANFLSWKYLEGDQRNGRMEKMKADEEKS